MQPAQLDLTPLVNAHASLVTVLSLPALDPVQAVVIRDAAIQRFEYTFGLSIKMLRRFLELHGHSQASIDELDFRDLLRVGGEVGLIDDVGAWFDFREQRNITSHAYDEVKAKKIYATIPAFAAASGQLLANMQSRLASL